MANQPALDENKLRQLLGPLAQRLIYYEETDSTNERAKELMRQGHTLPILLAASQTQGKGRLGRTFVSPRGSGLYLSFVLEAPDPALPLTPLVAVAGCEGIQAATGLSPGVKWVNDLMLQEKKVSGTLCESVNGQAVVGSGFNVNRPGQNPLAHLPHAGYLSDFSGAFHPLEELAAQLILALERMRLHIGDPAFVQQQMQHYRRRLITLGRPVRIIEGDRERVGFAQDLDPSGALLVEVNGKVETIHFGDVSVRGLHGYV